MSSADETFSEPEANVIASTSGFSVRVLGRTGLRYVEGGHSVWIDSEVLAAPPSIVMAPHSMRAWEGPEPRPVSEPDRRRVAGNIKRAFEACGYELEIAEPFDWGSVAMRRPEERERKRYAYEAGVSQAGLESGGRGSADE